MKGPDILSFNFQRLTCWVKICFQIANISFRVTRTLFIFAELTNLDPRYTGPVFNFDSIIRELVAQVGEKESGRLVICKRTQLLRKALLCNTLPATARSPPFCIPAVVNTIHLVHAWFGPKVPHKQNFGEKWLWDPTTNPHHEGRHPPTKRI